METRGPFTGCFPLPALSDDLSFQVWPLERGWVAIYWAAEPFDRDILAEFQPLGGIGRGRPPTLPSHTPRLTRRFCATADDLHDALDEALTAHQQLAPPPAPRPLPSSVPDEAPGPHEEEREATR